MEQWKKIIYEDQYTGYSVSSLGNIRNDKTNRILAKQKMQDYETVGLAISRICSNTPGLHTHKGYKWKIVDDIVQYE